MSSRAKPQIDNNLRDENHVWKYCSQYQLLYILESANRHQLVRLSSNKDVCTAKHEVVGSSPTQVIPFFPKALGEHTDNVVYALYVRLGKTQN